MFITFSSVYPATVDPWFFQIEIRDSTVTTLLSFMQNGSCILWGGRLFWMS